MIARTRSFEKNLLEVTRFVQAMLEPGESIEFDTPSIFQRQYHYRFPLYLRDSRFHVYGTSLDFRIDPEQPEMVHFLGSGSTYNYATDKPEMFQAIYRYLEQRRIGHERVRHPGKQTCSSTK